VSPAARPPDRRRLIGVVLLGAAVLAALLLWQRPNPFASETEVRAIVDDAAGLAPIGADVRMAGTPVGRVTARRRVGEDAELTLTLTRSAGPVHRDASAALRPRLAFEGTAYVELRPGTPGAPLLGDAVIPRSRTSTYVPLGDALGVLRAGRRADLQAVADALARTLREPATGALNDVLRRSPRLVAALPRVARAARGRHGRELRSAVTGLARTARAIAARADDLAPAADDAAATARAIRAAGAPGAALGTAASAGAAGTAGGAAPSASGAAGATAPAASGPALDAALARLPATVARLRDGGRVLRGTLGRTGALTRDARPAAARLRPALGAARPLLREAAPALRRAAPLLADARAGLDAAGPAARPARAVVRGLSPTLDILDGSLLGALERRTALGTPAYLSFLGLFAGGGGASAPFSPSGDGHFMRFGLRFLTGVGQPLPPCTLLAKAAPALATTLAGAGGCTP
jgi:ABC-type transporter Mla subunit MlaD